MTALIKWAVTITQVHHSAHVIFSGPELDHLKMRLGTVTKQLIN